MEQSKGGHMKKRILLMLCICMCILGLAACGKDPKEMDYNGSSYAELEETSINVWENIQTWDMQEIEAAVKEIDAMSEAEQIRFYEETEGARQQVALFKGWISVSKEAGSYVGVESFSVTKSGKATTTELILEFENRPVVLTIVYKNRDMTIESTTIDLVYSSGEKVQKALLNTVIGMVIVFVMLIIICLIISCFSVIPKVEKWLETRKQKKEAAKEEEQELPEAEAVVVPIEDDLELIAVIAAAIAASTGQSTDDFVVRSIKRR